jgi:hypothetical protein
VIIKKNKKKSLILFKTYALKPALSVATRVVQKLIKKKELKPINSQPKKSITKLLDITKKIILITKKFIKSKNLSTNGSYLK